MSDWMMKLRNRDLAQFDRLGPLVLCLLIVYVCWKLASLFWLVIAPAQPMQMERVMLGSQQAQAPNISSFSLFQEAKSINQGTDTNLVLQGVMVAVPHTFSSAVIRVADKSERYRVGDQIEGSPYILSEVYWDRVVLSQGAVLQELKFKGIENGLDQPLFAEQQTNSYRSSSVSDASMEQANRQAEQSREEHLRNMGIQSTENGLEIGQNMPTSVRQRLGLQAGDRVLSVNGQRLTTGQNELQIFEQAKQQGQAKIEIQRGDQVVTIQQDFK